MRYLQIRHDLVLVEQTVPASPKVKAVPATTNHILIFDRSYSMSNELRGLGEDIILKLKELPVGDTVTLGWFAGEGQNNFILKGFKINEEGDYKALEKAVHSNLTPIGCTCFSEILANSDQVINDLSVFSDNFTLSFFTDGYPVVSNRTKEVKQIHEALKVIENKITAGLFIGYGNYYNKQLMGDMAESLGGSLTHCSSLGEYQTQLAEFFQSTTDVAKKIKVNLATDTAEKDIVFSLNGGAVNSYEVSPENTVNFIPNKASASHVYVLTKTAPRGATEVELTADVKDPAMLKGAYAAALLLTQKAKSDEALEILGAVGDVALINKINNAFTLEEYGKVEGKLKRAVTHNKARFVEGRNTDYLPPKDAFCLLDALDVLLADEENYFLPRHKDFNYRKIGVGSAPEEGYAKFEAEENPTCPISALTWNQKKLNLSVRAKIAGTIELKEGYDKVGFQKTYPTFVYRNYALVKDGFLNIKKLPVKLSKTTLKFFNDIDLIEKASDGTDILVLEKIPVINRAIADGYTSATVMCRNVYNEIVTQAHLKALKFVKQEIVGEGEDKSEVLTRGQENFLKENGIGKNGYAPPMVKGESNDFYYAKEFAVKVTGHSSLPKISDVRNRLVSGKALTATGALVNEGLVLSERAKGSDKVKLATLDDLIKAKGEDLLKIRQHIQRTKFAILLASKWFEEFDSREDNTINVGGKTFTFDVREVTVKV